MKKVAITLMIAVLSFSLVSSIAFAIPPEEEWNHTFGGPNNDYAESLQQTSDGGYIITGNTQSYGTGNSDVWLIKTDSSGIEEWNKTFGGPNYDHGYSVQQTSDGGYIIAGDTTSYGAGNYDVWLIKTNSDGNEEWNKTFGGSEWDRSYSVQQTSDGGYIVVGGTRTYGKGNSDVWLIKTDSDGIEEWNKPFGGLDDDCGYSVQQTTDGGYIIAGDTTSYVTNNSDVWLIKTDSDGIEEWNKPFVGSNYDYGRSVQQTSDGGYIITGYTASYGAGNYDVWLIKTDPSGNKVWDKTFGGSGFDRGYSVQQTSDGGYIVTGYTESYGAGNWDMWLIKTGPSGNKVWDKTFGGLKNEYGSSVHQASDGGYIITGSTNSYGSGLFDVWLIKVEPEAPAIPSIDSVSPSSGDQGETLDITITGANLTGATDVSLDTGITVNSFTVDNATQITAGITIDSGAAPGIRDVSVTTPDGSGTLISGFTVTAPSSPTVTGISPSSGNQGETLDVTITGANLTGADDVSLGTGIAVNSFTVDSDTQITAGITIDSDASLGPRDVLVTTLDGSDTLASGFIVTAPSLPTVTGISPSSGNQGETLDVTITGANLTGATVVSLGTGIAVNSFTVGSDTQITAGITIDSDASLGPRDVLVTTLDGSDTLASGFTVMALSSPRVTGISPSSGDQGETLDVTITGANLTGADDVSLGTGIAVNSFTVDSATQITSGITIDSDASLGPRDVLVTTLDGSDTLASGFIVTAPSLPTVTGISPSSGNQGETLDVTITGANLTGATVVSLGTGIAVNSFTVGSDTQITAGITIDSDASLGPRDVLVTTLDGSDTLASGFIVTAPSLPTVTRVSPSSGDQGEALDVTITGANLTGADDVSLGTGIAVNSFTVDSDTQITVGITIDSDASLGPRDVSVTTLDGSDTLASGFTVTAPSFPTVTGVSPSSGDQGETLDVIITGANLTGATAVSFGTGIAVNSRTVDSDTQITAGITIDSDATIGTRDVSVTTLDGFATLASGFTVTAPSFPTVTGVSPSSGDQGETLDVIITGANLTGATAVSFGTGITVNSFTVDSYTQITTNISIDAKAVTEERNVSVTTPGGTDILEDCFMIIQDYSESSFKLYFKLTNYWIFFIAASEAVIILTCIIYFIANKKSH